MNFDPTFLGGEGAFRTLKQFKSLIALIFLIATALYIFLVT